MSATGGRLIYQRYFRVLRYRRQLNSFDKDRLLRHDVCLLAICIANGDKQCSWTRARVDITIFRICRHISTRLHERCHNFVRVCTIKCSECTIERHVASITRTGTSKYCLLSRQQPSQNCVQRTIYRIGRDKPSSINSCEILTPFSPWFPRARQTLLQL